MVGSLKAGGSVRRYPVEPRTSQEMGLNLICLERVAFLSCNQTGCQGVIPERQCAGAPGSRCRFPLASNLCRAPSPWSRTPNIALCADTADAGEEGSNEWHPWWLLLRHGQWSPAKCSEANTLTGPSPPKDAHAANHGDTLPSRALLPSLVHAHAGAAAPHRSVHVPINAHRMIKIQPQSGL